MWKYLAILISFSTVSFGQTPPVGPQNPVVTSTTPSGSCSAGAPLYQVLNVGLYQCVGGTWTAIGGGGSGTINGVTAGSGLSGGGSSGNVSVALSTPVSIPNGGTNATTAAAALANLNGVSTVQTAAQQLSGPLLSPYLNGIPSVDGTVAPTFSIATFSSITPYVPCNAVTYGGQNYIATSASIGQTPGTGTPGTYWDLTLNQGTLTNVTQTDCAFAIMRGIAVNSGITPVLTFGSMGTYYTCTGLNEGALTTGGVSLIGQGNSWSGGGGRKPTTVLQIQSGCTTEAISHQNIASSSAGMPNLIFQHILVNANGQGRCWDLNGLEAPLIDGLDCTGGYDSTNAYWAAFGDRSQPSGYFYAVSDFDIRESSVVNNLGEANGTNLAQITISGSTATPTLNPSLKGNYYNAILSTGYYFKGYCSGTYPAYTMNVVNGGSFYYVNSITQTTAGVGCGTAYLIVPDVAQVQEGLVISGSDGTGKNIRVWGVGTKAGLLEYGKDVKLDYVHNVGQAVCVYDGGGAQYTNFTPDSCQAYGMEINSAAVVHSSEWIYNATYPGSSGYLMDANATYARVENNTCDETVSGWQAVTQVSSGSNSPLSTQIVTNVANCDGSNTVSNVVNGQSGTFSSQVIAFGLQLSLASEYKNNHGTNASIGTITFATGSGTGYSCTTTTCTITTADSAALPTAGSAGSFYQFTCANVGSSCTLYPTISSVTAGTSFTITGTLNDTWVWEIKKIL